MMMAAAKWPRDIGYDHILEEKETLFQASHLLPPCFIICPSISAFVCCWWHATANGSLMSSPIEKDSNLLINSPLVIPNTVWKKWCKRSHSIWSFRWLPFERFTIWNKNYFFINPSMFFHAILRGTNAKANFKTLLIQDQVIISTLRVWTLQSMGSRDSFYGWSLN